MFISIPLPMLFPDFLKIDISDLSYIWINGNFTGIIKTCVPKLNVSIGKDFNGKIMPNEILSGLFMSVKGFMSKNGIEKLLKNNFSHFSATIHISDQEEGLHFEKDKCFGRNKWGVFWIIHNEKSKQ